MNIEETQETQLEATIPAQETLAEAPVINETASEITAAITAATEPSADIPADIAAESPEPPTDSQAAEPELHVQNAAAEAELAAPSIAAEETSQHEIKEPAAPGPDQEKLNALYEELKEKNARNEAFDVIVKSRIRGGLRVMYDDAPLFLPASHFSLKRSPAENELTEAIGMELKVLIHEMQELDEGRKAIIVSRKQILLNDFWNTINVGDVIEGRISSIASFGVFVDMGGIEGLIHISRLSQSHVDDPNSLFKKGDKIKAAVVELDREKNRIALSRKELEKSPWSDIETEFPIGGQHKGVIRKITDFGAYVELRPGVDGLLRTSEISWTKRLKKPSDVFEVGQEIPVEILSIIPEKRAIALSYKKTQHNPWDEIAEKYPVNSELNGIVSQVMPQGVIITLDDAVDGFMPRSKIKSALRGKKIPYQPGDKIEVTIADLVPGEESLILAPTGDEEVAGVPERREFTPRAPRAPKPQAVPAKLKPTQTSINLADMLSEEDRKTLFGTVDE